MPNDSLGFFFFNKRLKSGFATEVNLILWKKKSPMLIVFLTKMSKLITAYFTTFCFLKRSRITMALFLVNFSL